MKMKTTSLVDAGTLPLLPAPQRVERMPGLGRRPGAALKTYIGAMPDVHAKRLVAALVEGGVTVEPAATPEQADLQLRLDPVLPLPQEVRKDVLDQAYILEWTSGGAKISARAPSGLFYGIMTWRQLLAQDVPQPALRIIDWPNLPRRGAHLTGWCLTPTYESLHQLIAALAAFKVNCIIFQYDDRFPFERYPFLAAKTAFTKDQLRALIVWAEDHYITFNPLLDSLAHAGVYLAHKAFRHLAETENDRYLMCPSNPQTLAFVQELWREVLEVHRGCEFAHITGDEVFRQKKYCPACEPLIQQGRQSELYCRYYGALSRWIMEQNARPVIWSDMVMKYPANIHELPRGLVIHDWNYWVFQGMREEQWTSTFIFGESAITRENLSALPPEMVSRYKPYWLHPSTAPGFTPFPYARYFQDQGFDVLGGPVANGEIGVLPVPDFSLSILNNQYYAKALSDAGSLGLVTTFWAGHRTPVASMHTFLAAAAHAWKFTRDSEWDFLDTMERVFMHSPAQRLRDIGRLLDAANWPSNGYVTGEAEPFPDVADSALDNWQHHVDGNPLSRDYGAALRVNVEIARLVRDLREACRRIDRQLIGQGPASPIDFRPLMNRRLDTTLHIRGRALADMGHGLVTSWGVPFELVDPAANNGHSVLSLFGMETPDRPKKAMLSIRAPYARLFMLHVGMYAAPGYPLATYRIRLADGTTSVFNIVVGDNVGDWYSHKIHFIDHGVIAWRERIFREGGHPIQTHLTWWDNPMPGTAIESIEWVSGSGETSGYYTLIALTGRTVVNPMPSLIDASKMDQELNSILTRHASVRRALETVYRRLTPETQIPQMMWLWIDVPGVIELYRRKLHELKRGAHAGTTFH